jgi:hypothetical protein
MHQMLHGMHGHRRHCIGDIENALYPQQRLAMAVEQHCQPEAEPRPIDSLVDAESEGADIVGVAMVTVGDGVIRFRRLPGSVILA